MASPPLVYCCFHRRSTDHYDLTYICTVIDVFSSEYRVDLRFAHLNKLIQITQPKNMVLQWVTVLLYSSRHTLSSILDFILLATQCVSPLSLLCDLLTAVSRSRMPPSSRSDGTLTLEEQLLYMMGISRFTWTSDSYNSHSSHTFREKIAVTFPWFWQHNVTRHHWIIDRESGQHAASQADTQPHTDSYSFCQSLYLSFSCLADGFVCFNAASTSSVLTGSISSLGSGVERPSSPSG